MRRLLILAVFIALGFVVARSRRAAVAPAPAREALPPKLQVVEQPWLEPVDGDCPPGHPVKAKLSSGIYHLPGMLAYDRTHPDRCYRDAASAEADGLRAAKR